MSKNYKSSVYWYKVTYVDGTTSVRGSLRPTRSFQEAKFYAISSFVEPNIKAVEICSELRAKEDL